LSKKREQGINSTLEGRKVVHYVGHLKLPTPRVRDRWINASCCCLRLRHAALSSVCHV